MLLKAKGLVKDGKDDATIEASLNDAHALCKTDGVDNVSHSSTLLDIYALKIQIAEKKNNLKAQKGYFERSLPLTSAGLASNSVLGEIFRCGGRVRLFDSKYAEASQHFCEAFKNYDECRNSDGAEECLKLWVFASLLSGSPVNPFDDHRASVYLNKLALKNFERIVKAVLQKNIEAFLHAIKPALRDPLVNNFVPALQRVVQKSVFLDLAKPYSNISLPFLATKLAATPEETEGLLVEMSLDGDFQGKIDQTAGILYLRPPVTASEVYYNHLSAVAINVSNLQNAVLTAVN